MSENAFDVKARKTREAELLRSYRRCTDEQQVAIVTFAIKLAFGGRESLRLIEEEMDADVDKAILKELLHQKGITSKKLSDDLGLCLRTIYDKLNGERPFKNKEMRRIFEYADVPDSVQKLIWRDKP